MVIRNSISSLEFLPFGDVGCTIIVGNFFFLENGCTISLIIQSLNASFIPVLHDMA